uniref:Regulatory protein zeste n=1 Tax=Romanomermis culicivorax TaxID=13658 RepID=A0A915I2D0_ROMCU
MAMFNNALTNRLIELHDERAQILDAKTKTGAMNRIKSAAWKEVTKTLNQEGGGPFTMGQVKKRWANIKEISKTRRLRKIAGDLLETLDVKPKFKRPKSEQNSELEDEQLDDQDADDDDENSLLRNGLRETPTPTHTVDDSPIDLANNQLHQSYEGQFVNLESSRPILGMASAPFDQHLASATAVLFRQQLELEMLKSKIEANKALTFTCRKINDFIDRFEAFLTTTVPETTGIGQKIDEQEDDEGAQTENSDEIS